MADTKRYPPYTRDKHLVALEYFEGEERANIRYETKLTTAAFSNYWHPMNAEVRMRRDGGFGGVHPSDNYVWGRSA